MFLDHFIGNVDELCNLSNEAHLYVVRGGKESKSDKNVTDSQYSLAMVQSCTSENASSPFLFLGSAKNMKN